jgi:prepilin-type processing-associated H-X9-DG protein
MPIPFTCPHCGKSSTIDDRFAGQSGPCGACGKPITVPFPASPYGAPPKSGGGTGAGLIIGILAAVLVAGGCVIALLAALLLPAVQAARGAARRSASQNNLKQIGLALHNYHDTYRQLPPAIVKDADGKPLYSWRVVILPFMEQNALYQQWDKDKAWDSPENMALSNSIIASYRSPADDGPPTGTNYFMVVGPDTMFPPDRAISFADCTDGLSNTIAVIETKGIAGNWAAPIDPEFDKLVLQIGKEPGKIQPVHPGGTNVLLGDGSVRFVSEALDSDTLRRLLLRKDGQVVNDY